MGGLRSGIHMISDFVKDDCDCDCRQNHLRAFDTAYHLACCFPKHGVCSSIFRYHFSGQSQRPLPHRRCVVPEQSTHGAHTRARERGEEFSGPFLVEQHICEIEDGIFLGTGGFS